MANTTFKGTVRAESGLKVSAQTAAIQAVIYQERVQVKSQVLLTYLETMSQSRQLLKL